MTHAERILITKLLQGAYITKVHGKYTLYEGNRIPVIRVRESLYRRIYPILKDDRKKGRMVISIRSVQRLHGNSLIKKQYKGKVKILDKGLVPSRKRRKSKPTNTETDPIIKNELF